MFFRWSLALLVLTAASPAMALPDGVDHAGLGHESLDLDELVAEALRAHPRLLSMREIATATGEVRSRVGSLPDPIVSVGASNFRIDDPGLGTSPMTGVVFGWQQGLPYPGKLARRKELASRAEDVALERVVATEARVELAVRERYWALHFAQAALAVTQESVDIVADLSKVVEARFSVGKAAQQDALQAQLAESQLLAMIEEREQALLTAQRELNAAVGRAPEDGLGATVEPTVVPLDPEELRSQLDQNNPAMSVARAQVEASEAALREAKVELVPDFAVGADYRVRGTVPGDGSQGADMFSAGVRMSVPLWAATKQGARIREQRYRSSAAAAGYEDTALLALTALERGIDEVQRLDREIDLYRDQVVPQAEQTLDASIDDYTVAEVGFVSVLQNWQILLTYQLDLERLSMQRARQVARIRALIGGPPETSP